MPSYGEGIDFTPTTLFHLTHANNNQVGFVAKCWLHTLFFLLILAQSEISITE